MAYGNDGRANRAVGLSFSFIWRQYMSEDVIRGILLRGLMHQLQLERGVWKRD
jgi:hypothetical protein